LVKEERKRQEGDKIYKISWLEEALLHEEQQ